MNTKQSMIELAEPVAYAALLSLPLVAMDAANGCAIWQREPTPADIDALETVTAELDMDGDIDALLSLTDEQLAALDIEHSQLAIIESFPDGLGWDWPGTDWNQEPVL